MNRAFSIVGLIALGAIIILLIREADDDTDEASPPPPVPSPTQPAVRTESLQCPMCEGYSYIMVPGRTGPRRQVCQFCAGKGGKVLKIPPGHIRCPMCQGFGKTPTPQRYIVCARCNGRGYIKQPFQPTE